LAVYIINEWLCRINLGVDVTGIASVIYAKCTVIQRDEMADGLKRNSLVFDDDTKTSADKLLAESNPDNGDHAVGHVGNVDAGVPKYVQRYSFRTSPSPYDDEKLTGLAAAFFGR
tara:strand:- start:13576 stop:13920 length:345 start_codon:yes stop_codon:yes gene_type:complete